MYFAVLSKRKILRTLAVLILIPLLALIVSGSGAITVFNGYSVKKLPIYRVETPQKKVALTFDCAWGTDYTDKLLQIMSSNNVKCTFFTVEFWANKHADYLKKISDDGHEIGTHSATHPYMSRLDKNAITRELNSSKQIIETVTGKKVQLFRPPYGDYDDLLIDTASELGLYTIQWDVDSLDWKNLSAKSIEDRVLERVKNGSIVLFHNQGLHTADALDKIIKSLKKNGYEIVRVGDLIYKDNYKMAVDGTQIKNS